MLILASLKVWITKKLLINFKDGKTEKLPTWLLSSTRKSQLMIKLIYSVKKLMMYLLLGLLYFKAFSWITLLLEKLNLKMRNINFFIRVNKELCNFGLILNSDKSMFKSKITTKMPNLSIWLICWPDASNQK